MFFHTHNFMFQRSLSFSNPSAFVGLGHTWARSWTLQPRLPSLQQWDRANGQDSWQKSLASSEVVPRDSRTSMRLFASVLRDCSMTWGCVFCLCGNRCFCCWNCCLFCPRWSVSWIGLLVHLSPNYNNMFVPVCVTVRYVLVEI